MNESMLERMRETHRDPRNVAMHVAGGLVALSAVRKLLRGRLGGAVVHGALAAALMGAGHVIEGNEPFGAVRERFREERKPAE